MVGDEAELFERYHKRLLRVTAYKSRASWDNVEEACGFAWAALVRRDDVRRDTVFAWLKEVARNEAWRLEHLSRETVPLDAGPGTFSSEVLPLTSGNSYVTPEALGEAMARLKTLPERQQVVVAMRALGWKYADMAEALGITTTRVNHWLVRADQQLHRLRERDLADQHPLTARLRDLEDHPPQYLRDAIGAPPRANPRRPRRTEHVREWRRLALAIEEHRDRHDVSDSKRALGPLPRDPVERAARDALRSQIDGFQAQRDRFGGMTR